MEQPENVGFCTIESSVCLGRLENIARAFLGHEKKLTVP